MEWVLVFDLGISARGQTILQNFQGSKLVFSRVSEDKGASTKTLITLSRFWLLRGWRGGERIH